MRADQLLVQRGLAASRSQAARLIESGARWLHRGEWKPLRKSDDLHEDAQIELTNADEAKYVSRGGLKLEGALKTSSLDVRDALCLDVGQSTGGFTDCLLQHGARAVVGVDVGHSQLHARLRADERVLCVQRVNARALTATELIANYPISTSEKSIFLTSTTPKQVAFDVVVGDVSFISQTLVVDALVGLLAPVGQLLMLVKPQFELQPEQIGKGGIVKDPAHYVQVQERICAAYKEAGLKVEHYFASPIEGGDGNREFFVHARRV